MSVLIQVSHRRSAPSRASLRQITYFWHALIRTGATAQRLRPARALLLAVSLSALLGCVTAAFRPIRKRTFARSHDCFPLNPNWAASHGAAGTRAARGPRNSPAWGDPDPGGADPPHSRPPIHNPRSPKLQPLRQPPHLVLLLLLLLRSRGAKSSPHAAAAASALAPLPRRRRRQPTTPHPLRTTTPRFKWDEPTYWRWKNMKYNYTTRIICIGARCEYVLQVLEYVCEASNYQETGRPAPSSATVKLLQTR